MGISVEWDQVLKEGIADTVTYNPLGVSGSAISAAWIPEPEPNEFHEDGKWAVRSGRLVCKTSDVSSPSNRDTVTISGETWQVDDEMGIERDNSGGVILPLVIKTRIEVSGPDHRLRR